MAEEDDADALEGAAAAEPEEEEPEQFDKLNVDFPIEFARDLLAQSKSGRRRELLASARSYFDSVRGSQRLTGMTAGQKTSRLLAGEKRYVRALIWRTYQGDSYASPVYWKTCVSAARARVHRYRRLSACSR